MFFCSRSQQDVDAALTSYQAQGYAVHGMAADVAQKEQREQLLQQVGMRGFLADEGTQHAADWADLQLAKCFTTLYRRAC